MLHAPGILCACIQNTHSLRCHSGPVINSYAMGSFMTLHSADHPIDGWTLAAILALIFAVMVASAVWVTSALDRRRHSNVQEQRAQRSRQPGENQAGHLTER